MKVDTYEIFIYNADISYLPLSEMGDMAALRISLLKSLFGIDLNQMTVNSLSFLLTGWAIIASAFAISEETAGCLLSEKSSCLVVQLILSSKVSFWFAERITLQQRNFRALTKRNLCST